MRFLELENSFERLDLLSDQRLAAYERIKNAKTKKAFIQEYGQETYDRYKEAERNGWVCMRFGNGGPDGRNVEHGQDSIHNTIPPEESIQC